MTRANDRISGTAMERIL